ncbi:MAG: DNA-3-methyladenine glycosylase 2 family protein [Gemmatimonadaceae bacterium]|nr:DNA-3-methyladenine glycosylase 2 family protein [Gloeobacterales cyanobacterium ES-bin-141]
MHRNFELCYRAICSRDQRFDGQFFTAVTSTGIYCRPICPARTPLPANVRFYPSAASAVAAGFRACRRCRPESGPGSADWNVRADLVGRALRLIAGGTVDGEGVGGLADRLAVSPRHLHRELVAEVGAGPLALARTRRVQTARLLVDETDLPLTDVAFAAGFASIRQFNEAMQASFGCPPSALRRRTAPDTRGMGGVVLRLPYRPPLAADALLAYFARRAVPGVEEVTGESYRRTVALPHATGIVQLQPVVDAGYIRLQVYFEDLRDLGLLVQRCRNLFDLDADPVVIRDALGADVILAPLLAARPGLRVPGSVDGFEAAVRAILAQQISVAAARTLAGRLVRAFGEPLAVPQGHLTHVFPKPEAMAQVQIEDLRNLGLTRSRATALRALAVAVCEQKLVLDRGADWNETAARLLKLPGVGPWTVSCIAMRALGDPDAFPVGDLALRQALERAGLTHSNHTESWRPWRAYAAQHLWTI